MFLLIESGFEVQVCRHLSPTETLDIDHHAEQYGRAMGYPVDLDSRSPSGIGADIDITIQRTKKPGSPVVWSSAGYWFKTE